MPGGAGGSDDAGDKGPASFKTEMGGVNAFLAAVRARDPVRLKEATALRARTECKPHNQKFFEAILGETLGPDDLDELAKALEGFKVADMNTPKTTRTRGFILRKAGKKSGAFLQRTITVRQEKAGWKVVDISGEGKLDAPIMMPTMRGYSRTPRRR